MTFLPKVWAARSGVFVFCFLWFSLGLSVTQAQPAAGTQSFEEAISILCAAPSRCMDCAQKKDVERQAALADFIAREATNSEFVALFEKLPTVSLEKGQELLAAAIRRAGIKHCGFIEDAKSWRTPPVDAIPKALDEQPSMVAKPVERKDSSQTPGPGYQTMVHPAASVADEILTAIAARDVVGIQAYFNAVNRRKIVVDRIPILLEETLKQTAGIRRTTELRAGPKFMGPGALLAKVRVVGDDVWVLVLTREGSEYRFEDLNSPSIERYRAQPLIWKREE